MDGRVSEIILRSLSQHTKARKRNETLGHGFLLTSTPTALNRDEVPHHAGARLDGIHFNSVTQTPTLRLAPGGPTKLPPTGGTDSGKRATATAM